MSHNPTQARPDQSSANDSLRAVSRLVFFGFAAIAAFYLITEHRAHLYGALPFLLLAACPLLHFFHHRGHGVSDEPSESEAAAGKRAPPDAGVR